MKRVNIILLLTFTITSSCFAQFDIDSVSKRLSPTIDLNRYFSVLAGYNFWGHHFAEIGIAINQFGRVGYHPSAWAYFLSSEFQIGNKMLVAPKFGVWAGGGAGGLAMGLNFLWYTDFNQSSMRFRPEIGMGFGRWKIVYGYNIPITNKDFKEVNNDNVSLVLLFGIKKLKSVRE